MGGGSRESGGKRHISEAGVEWVVGEESPFEPEALMRLLAAENFFSSQKLVPAERRERAAEILERVKVYLSAQGISRDTLKKLDSVTIQASNSFIDTMAGGGAWNPVVGSIQIGDVGNAIIAHEVSHAAGRNKYFASRRNQDHSNASSPVVIRRSGLETATPEHRFFSFLNEILTDEIAVRALGQSKEGPHTQGRAFLNKILKSVASSEKKRNGKLTTTDKVWVSLLQSYFQGWSPDLKHAITNAFGKDALKILAHLNGRYLTFDYIPDHVHYRYIKELKLENFTDDVSDYFTGQPLLRRQIEKRILNKLPIIRERMG